jgi:hypothetical protein
MTSTSEYISSSFESFRKSHKDYLETFTVNITSDVVEIRYMFWLYDLLDKDLDFSEEFYETLQDSFRDWIGKHAQLVTSECKVKVIINEDKQIFRNCADFLSRRTFETLESDHLVKYTVERILKV